MKILLLILISLCCVMASEISTSERGLKHKLHYGVIFFHIVYGVVVTLVIIKIVLAMTFVGMLSGLFHMFAGIKYLLKNYKGSEILHHAAPEYYPHDFHHYEFSGPSDLPEYYKSHPDNPESFPALGRVDMNGGRSNSGINLDHVIKKRGIDLIKKSASSGRTIIRSVGFIYTTIIFVNAIYIAIFIYYFYLP